MITAGDKVKILDFGLAKALSGETQAADASQSPTITEAMTQPGIVLGTAAYNEPGAVLPSSSVVDIDLRHSGARYYS
jgi:serine/threonine protein kinase